MELAKWANNGLSVVVEISSYKQCQIQIERIENTYHYAVTAPCIACV